MYSSIADAVKTHANEKPDAPCIICNDLVHTYAQVATQMERIAARYKAQGISHGERVAIDCTQDAEFLINVLACQNYGAVSVPLERGISHERQDEIISAVGATLHITASGKWQRPAPHSDAEEVSPPEDLAEILHTTGTTGKPKGVMITNRNNIALAENSIGAMQTQSDNIEFIPTMLSHSLGLRSSYVNFLAGGAVLVTSGVAWTGEVLRQMREYSTTAMTLTPTMATSLIACSKDRLSLLSKQIRYIMIASGQTGEDIVAEFMKKLPTSRLYNSYGATEAARSCTLEFNKNKYSIGCIGKPSKHTVITIVDDNHNKINSSKNHMGTLAISGPMCSMGYWEDYCKTNFKPNNDTIYTADVGYIDAKGFVYTIGRKDDVINCNGIKISPEEIERYVRGYSGIADCACIPKHDAVSGQVPVLFVQTEENQTLNEKKFMQYLSTKLDSTRQPKQLNVIDKIPRTATGKIKRVELEKLTSTAN